MFMRPKIFAYKNLFQLSLMELSLCQTLFFQIYISLQSDDSHLRIFDLTEFIIYNIWQTVVQL